MWVDVGISPFGPVCRPLRELSRIGRRGVRDLIPVIVKRTLTVSLDCHADPNLTVSELVDNKPITCRAAS